MCNKTEEKEVIKKLQKVELEVEELKQQRELFAAARKRERVNASVILELSLVIISFWVAAVLFMKSNALDTFPDMLASFSEPYHWGTLFGLNGTISLYGIFKGQKQLRRGSLMFSAVVYSSISAGFFLLGANNINMSSVIYAVFALQAFYAFREVGELS